MVSVYIPPRELVKDASASLLCSNGTCQGIVLHDLATILSTFSLRSVGKVLKEVALALEAQALALLQVWALEEVALVVP